MRVYKEAEAVGYLERLNTSMEGFPFVDEPPFPNFKAALLIELSYFRRLLRDPAKKELAVLGVSPAGFPELPSLTLDVQKAYEELNVIETEVGKSVYPLFQQLRVTDNLTTFDEGVTQVLADFEKDQEHINLLKELQTYAQRLIIKKYIPDPLNTDNYSNDGDDWGASIYTKEENDSLLFFDRGVRITYKDYSNLLRQIGHRNIDEWEYVTGFLKYIDLMNSDPILVYFRKVATSDRKKTVYGASNITISPDSSEFVSLLEPLNQAAKDMILSVNYTNFSDEKFRHFVESASKIGTLLKHVEIKPENLQIEPTFALPPKGWRRLLSGSKNE